MPTTPSTSAKVLMTPSSACATTFPTLTTPHPSLEGLDVATTFTLNDTSYFTAPSLHSSTWNTSIGYTPRKTSSPPTPQKHAFVPSSAPLTPPYSGPSQPSPLIPGHYRLEGQLCCKTPNFLTLTHYTISVCTSIWDHSLHIIQYHNSPSTYLI